MPSEIETKQKMKNHFLLWLFMLLAASCTEKEDLRENGGKRNGQADIEQQIDNRMGEFVKARRFSEGIEYLDSLWRVPSMQQSCRYDVLVGKAYLYQMMGESEKAILCADEYMDLPAYPDAMRFINFSETVSGVYVYCSNDVHKAIQILEKAVEVYRNGTEHPNIIRIMSRLGIYYRLVGKYEKAAAINREVISLYNDSLPPKNIMIAYGEQANLYAELGLYKQALQYNAKALHYSLLKDSFGLGDIYRYRAEIFLQMGEKDSTFHYLRLGEQASAAIKSFRGVIVNRVEMLKAYLSYPDSLSKAVQLGWAICPDTVRVPNWAKYQLELYLGQALVKSGQSSQGIPLIEKASRGFASMEMVDMEYEANNLLLDYFREQGMNEDFMRYYSRNRLFADSLEANKKLRTAVASNIRFDAERKAKENEELSVRVGVQQRQLSHYIYISVVLLLVLVVSIAYILWKRKANRTLIERSKHEIQQLITRQQELNRHNEQLAEQVEQLTANSSLMSVHQLTCQSLLSKEDELLFRQSFATIHPYYLPGLRKHYPQLTRNEELLAMLISLGQSTDEIALVMGINRSSVNVMRSRMRKNMGLTKLDSLDEVVKQYLT